MSRIFKAFRATQAVYSKHDAQKVTRAPSAFTANLWYLIQKMLFTILLVVVYFVQISSNHATKNLHAPSLIKNNNKNNKNNKNKNTDNEITDYVHTTRGDQTHAHMKMPCIKKIKVCILVHLCADQPKYQTANISSVSTASKT